jgi:hypothetical protein
MHACMHACVTISRHRSSQACTGSMLARTQINKVAAQLPRAHLGQARQRIVRALAGEVRERAVRALLYRLVALLIRQHTKEVSPQHHHQKPLFKYIHRLLCHA